MAEIIEYFSEGTLAFGQLDREEKNRLVVADARGRTTKLPADRALFRYPGQSIAEAEAAVASLQAEVDVDLLWEALAGEEDFAAKETEALAALFFDETTARHCSAIFRALLVEKLHFRRQAKAFTPRRAEEIEELRIKREAEARAAAEIEALSVALRARSLDDEHAERVDRYLRGQVDKALDAAAQGLAKDPPRHLYDILEQSGRLGATADFEVLRANIDREHPADVVAFAEQQRREPPARWEPAAFTIDDPDTREVDDALTVCHQADGSIVVHVDIADASRFVQAGDPVDREAARRTTTVYLPTGTYYMIPEVISADRASLHRGAPRPVLRTSVTFDAHRSLTSYQLSRIWITVGARLDYAAADALLAPEAEGPVAEALRTLASVAEKLRDERKARGALFFSRPEWKLRVGEDARGISVQRIPSRSTSRKLVAEMMILANRLTAARALEARIPIIYRVQPPPADPLPAVEEGDPLIFYKLRGKIPPASLSLHPGPHFGLGVEGYTQVTSPLRRYGDLVQQRQLAAYLAGDPPPYSTADLLEVLATVEGVEREMKGVEQAVTQRWAMEYASRGERENVEARIVSETARGYRLQLASCGAVGICAAKHDRQIGEEVRVDIVEVKPKRGHLRLVLRDET